MNIIKMFYVKQMVRKIDKTIKVKKGKCLECDIYNNTIYVNNKTDKTDVETFKDYVKELNPKCKFNTLILGVLHEVGHLFTFDGDEDSYNRDNELLSLLFKENKINAKQFNEFYLRLPLESNATKWAIDFAMQNQKFCRYYQNKIGKEKIK